MSSNNPKPKARNPQPKNDSKLEGLQSQIVELTAALQRERADAENIRRHHNDQLANVKAKVKADVIRELLPVIDNVERALGHVPPELAQNDFAKGVQSVAKQFQKILEQLGVTRIPTVGQPFDPRLHEAISMDAGEGGDEVVSEELQAGYILGDYVIRHAMVRVQS